MMGAGDGIADAFLAVVDPRTLSFVDLPGNRKFISVGNLTHNDRVALILVDQEHRRRLKILGRLSVHEIHADGQPRRAKRIRVEAFDWNCWRQDDLAGRIPRFGRDQWGS